MTFLTFMQIHEIRVVLHDAETFIDDRHTNEVDDPDCPACALVRRLRRMSEVLQKEALSV